MAPAQLRRFMWREEGDRAHMRTGAFITHRCTVAIDKVCRLRLSMRSASIETKMASFGDPDESVFEFQRQSLLETIEDRNRALNKKGLLQRMVIISKMYHSNFTEIGQYYERLFKELITQNQTEPVTGLLLLYPKHCVHVIETSVDMILDILRDLRKESRAGEGHMEKSKILIISHDIPQRLYQQWSYRVLDIEAPNLDEYEPSDEPPAMVMDMLLQLLKLGVHINKQPKMGLKNTMETLHERVPELLPQQDVIGYLLENDDDVTVTPDAHLDKYEKPYRVTMASDLTWPMPIRLFPYN